MLLLIPVESHIRLNGRLNGVVKFHTVRMDLQSIRSRVLGFAILQGQIWKMRYFREKVVVFQNLCIFAVEIEKL